MRRVWKTVQAKSSLAVQEEKLQELHVTQEQIKFNLQQQPRQQLQLQLQLQLQPQPQPQPQLQLQLQLCQQQQEQYSSLRIVLGTETKPYLEFPFSSLYSQSSGGSSQRKLCGLQQDV